MQGKRGCAREVQKGWKVRVGEWRGQRRECNGTDGPVCRAVPREPAQLAPST